MKSSGRTLFSNGAWSLLNQITRVAALAVVTIALSRHFGPRAFGALVVGLALVRIFAVISTFGLDRVIVKQLAETAEDHAGILRSAFGLKFLIALATYLALLLFVRGFDPGNHLLFAIAAIAGAGLLFQPWDVFDYYFQANNQFRLTVAARTVPVLFATSLKLGAVAMGAPLLAFAALETVEMGLIALGIGFVYRRRRSIDRGSGRWSSIDARSLLRQGFPLLLGSLAAMIYMRSDVLILGRLEGNQIAGLYAAASQITEACALLPMAFLPALLPLLVQWRKQGAPFYRQQFERLFLLTFAGGGLVAVCLAISAPLLVSVLYGASYAPAARILIIHAWSAIFLFASIIQTGYEVTERLTWLTAARTIAGAVVNVVLNLILIPRYGASGSAYATLISLAGSGFLFNVVHPKARPIFWMQLRAFLLVPLVRSRFHNPIPLETGSRGIFPLPRPR